MARPKIGEATELWCERGGHRWRRVRWAMRRAILENQLAHDASEHRKLRERMARVEARMARVRVQIEETVPHTDHSEGCQCSKCRTPRA